MINRLNPQTSLPALRSAAGLRPAERPEMPPEYQVKPTGPPDIAPENGGLSHDEQQMIRRYFPDTPAMTLRLYGPGRESKNLNPTAIGSRLDLRG